jgi:hypothetical protein
VSHQDGFGNNRTEPTGSIKPDDDGMQKKSENVGHAEDGIRLKKLENSGNLPNSPPTGPLLLRWYYFHLTFGTIDV